MSKMLIFSEKKLVAESNEKAVYAALKSAGNVKAAKIGNLSQVVILAKQARSLYEDYIKSVANGADPGSSNKYYGKMDKAYDLLKSSIQSYKQVQDKLYNVYLKPFADTEKFEATGYGQK